MYPSNPGLRHLPAQLPPPPDADAGGPVGIVVADPADALAYLETVGGLPTDYVIIRTAADVPARLGGLVHLTDDWPEELPEALERACGLAGGA